MIEHFSIAVGVEAVKLVLEKIRAKFPSSQEEIKRAWDEITDEVTLETYNAFRAFAEEQVRTNAELAAGLADKIGNREATLLYLQLHGEALKSVLRERMRLMCAAKVGIFKPDLDIEMKSRVSRALASLEPRDVLLLRELETSHGREAFQARWDEPGTYSNAALVQAGCLGIPPGKVWGSTMNQITELGRAVIRFVDTWQPEDAREGKENTVGGI